MNLGCDKNQHYNTPTNVLVNHNQDEENEKKECLLRKTQSFHYDIQINNTNKDRFPRSLYSLFIKIKIKIKQNNFF